MFGPGPYQLCRPSEIPFRDADQSNPARFPSSVLMSPGLEVRAEHEVHLAVLDHGRSWSYPWSLGLEGEGHLADIFQQVREDLGDDFFVLQCLCRQVELR